MVVTPPTAGAQAQPTRFALGYSAPTVGCPSREAFVQAVSQRAPAALEVGQGEGALALDVRLQGSGDRARGTLVVRRPDGLSSQRDVPEGACAEVAESLAVMIAMLLEQRDFGESAPQSAPDGTPPADAAQPTDSDPVANPLPVPATPEPPRALKQGPPARVSSPSASVASTRASRRSAWGAGLTFSSVFESEASPSFALGFLVGVDGFWLRDSLWSPSVRVSAYQVDAGREVTEQGDATFRLRAVRLSACPLRWPAHARLSVHACAVFDAGELRARGEVALGRTLRMPWFAAGAGGRLAFSVLPFLDLEGEAVLQALSRHDEFVFEPNRLSVHSVAPGTVGASLGLTLRTF